MGKDLDKHKRIVRNRIAATAVTFVISAAILTAVFIGTFYLFASLKGKGGPGEEAGVPSTEEATDATVEITEAGLSKEPSEESVVPGETGASYAIEEIEEQYEELVNNEGKKANALEIEDDLGRMSLEEKVQQLFFVSPEQITGADRVTKAGDATKAALEKYHVGGIIYFSGNLLNPDQTTELLKNTQEFAMENGGVPLFLALDEEGGSVTRIASNPEFGIENTDTMEHIGEGNDPEKAYDAGKHIGEYLRGLGFNLDFAPVADVKQGKSVIGDRSFGSDGNKVSGMAERYAAGLNENAIIACYKHFPGFGRAENNTDLAAASSEATAEELKNSDLIPYEEGIKAGNDMMIMAGHVSFPAISGDDRPSSMSSTVITDYLRGELKYNGVVITDALNAAAVKGYTSFLDASECYQK